MLAALDVPQWTASTRCADWLVRDVVAHLVTVNEYWAASARAARRGAPLQLLGGFDPAAPSTALALETTEPSCALVVDIEHVDGLGTVTRRDAPADERPCLRGAATRLLDALSLRAPLPDDAPAAWLERHAAMARALASPSPSPGSG